MNTEETQDLPRTAQEVQKILATRKRPKSTPEQRDAAKTARKKADADYIAWSDRQDTTSQEMRASGLSPFTGGTEQPVFWQDGQAVEAGAARLDFYDARKEHEILIRTARSFEKQGSYQLPESFLLEAAQMFYQDGQLCEVRLRGYDLKPQPQPDENGQPIFGKWQTKIAPKITATSNGLKVATDSKRRPQIAALNETVREILTLERDYYTRSKATGKAQEPKNILRLHISWDLRQKVGGEIKRELPRVIRLPNTAPDRDLNRALMLYPDWMTNDNLLTRYHDGREGTTVVYQPPEVAEALQNAPEKAMKALDERFNKIKSEMTADVIEILFHHWKNNKVQTRRGDKATITLSRICEYRGVLPKGENLENAWRAMRDARSIRLTGGGVDAALFEMDSVDFLSPDVPDKDTAYFFSPGFLLQFELEENKLYFAPFLESVWRLDPYRNSEAKRLARFLRGEWRLNADAYLDPKTGERCYKTWRALLAEAGIFPDKWKEEGRKVSRELQNIEKAIETLFKLEFLAHRGDEIYHPDDRQRLKNLPVKGRLEAWLELRICLLPDVDIAEMLAQGQAKRLAQRERNAQAVAKAKARKALSAQEKRQKKAE